MDDPRDVFGKIYATDHWRGGSGEGSTEDASAPYRQIVQRLLASTEVRNVVEIGCGDWQVGSLQDWSGVSYLGLDVVPDVVANNQRRYEGPNVQFASLDAFSSQMPSGDLLLVKDVLQHWPNDAIRNFLTSVVPEYPFALIANDIGSSHWHGGVNSDIELGAWRPVDLEVPPFDLLPKHHWDFVVAGQWTKRVLLVATDRRWTPLSRIVPRSVRRIARSIELG